MWESLYTLYITDTTQRAPRPSSAINRFLIICSSIHSAPQRYYSTRRISTTTINTIRLNLLGKYFDRTVAKAFIADSAHSIFTNHHPSISSSIAPGETISQQ